MLMQTKSMSDRALLLSTGFMTPQGVDVKRLAALCGASERTAYRWQADGLPPRARHLLESVLIGDFLPAEWRRAGVKIASDRLYLQSGHSVQLKTLIRWPFIIAAVDWSKVPA